ncbi:MAG: hypothetical protein CL444_09490 [Acidimicrobiaceae bacterium]|nr:hypothetical protein [Acidimicrobiaceae bacterium]
MSRSEHIEGLELARLTPADVEYFFRTLLPRIPRSTGEDKRPLLDLLRSRLQETAMYLGDPLAVNFDPTDIEKAIDSICDRLERMKRRHWKATKDGTIVLAQLRTQVGEISADLHELAAR